MTGIFIQEKITELREKGFCVLKAQFSKSLINACREAFLPTLLEYLNNHKDSPNRGANRHFLPIPFNQSCFAPEFFFNTCILRIVHGAMDNEVVADQWGCDVPLQGSDYQKFHADYQRPLFAEAPELPLPAYMLVISFGLTQITSTNGPIEIAPTTHRMPRDKALNLLESKKIETQTVLLELGDVLIRHPWMLHRGTPNTTEVPRPLVTIRYVRRWYADHSREVNVIPQFIWQSLTPEQQRIMRFPLEASVGSY